MTTIERTKVLVEKVTDLLGHKDCVYTVKHSADSKYIYSGAGEGWLARWNTDTYEGDRVLAQAGASIYAIAEDTITKTLWIGQKQGIVHIIDIDKQTHVKSIQVSSMPVFCIEIDPRQNFVFVGTGDGYLSIFNLIDYKLMYHIRLAQPQANLKNIRSIAISQNTSHVAVACSDQNIYILDSASHFKVIHTLQGHTNSVFCVKYSPCENYLLSGSRDARLKIWNVKQSYTLYQDIVAHLFAINDIVFDPQGQYFATASADKTIKIWDANTFMLLKVIDRARNQSHFTSVNKLSWHKHLISCSDDKTIMVWNLNFIKPQQDTQKVA
ncbi:MAG: WD40 repeat domain-containing protein [Bacteroidia bacterium]|nr:WD40 repeat domain-containing protein [Bacteroidia bacterium]MDW8301901.1 WD40 repeat domain-containing protein [Bacteroidia bacterium]